MGVLAPHKRISASKLTLLRLLSESAEEFMRRQPWSPEDDCNCCLSNIPSIERPSHANDVIISSSASLKRGGKLCLRPSLVVFVHLGQSCSFRRRCSFYFTGNELQHPITMRGNWNLSYTGGAFLFFRIIFFLSPHYRCLDALHQPVQQKSGLVIF
jgi:hypothetical protein